MKTANKNRTAMPPVFVISLARAKERRAHMAEQLKGTPHEIVDAVDGATLDLNALAAEGRLRQDKAKKLYAAPLTQNEIGCYLSHYGLWERIAAQPQECALVLEDDVVLADDFFQVVADVANSPWHWEVTHLGSARPSRIKNNLHSVGNGRRFGLDPLSGGGAFAYLIRPTGAQKLLTYCREIRLPIDLLYIYWWRNGVAFYHVSPPAVKVLPHITSTIGKRGAQNIALVARISASIHHNKERIARWWAALNHHPRMKDYDQ